MENQGVWRTYGSRTIWCIALRSEIFVVEQNCVYLDLDGKTKLLHLIGEFDGKIVAHSRLRNPESVLIMLYRRVTVCLNTAIENGGINARIN
jgi:predicted GNAT family N-acyltransferase